MERGAGARRATLRSAPAPARSTCHGRRRGSARRHQSAVAQLTQVIRDQALALPGQLAQLADTPIAARELAQQPPAQRMAREPQKPRRRVCLAGPSQSPADITSSRFDACPPRAPGLRRTRIAGEEANAAERVSAAPTSRQPTFVSRKRWLRPPVSVNCCSPAPDAVEAPKMSRRLPLWRGVIVWIVAPGKIASRKNCWLRLPEMQGNWTTRAPSFERRALDVEAHVGDVGRANPEVRAPAGGAGLRDAEALMGLRAAQAARSLDDPGAGRCRGAADGEELDGAAGVARDHRVDAA